MSEDDLQSQQLSYSLLPGIDFYFILSGLNLEKNFFNHYE